MEKITDKRQTDRTIAFCWKFVMSYETIQIVSNVRIIQIE